LHLPALIFDFLIPFITHDAMMIGDSQHDEELNAAVSSGDTTELARLLQAAKPVNDRTVQSLLSKAAWKSNLAIVTFLLERYPSTPLEEETVRAAIYSGSIPLFSALMAKDPSIVTMQFDRRGTPLIVACQSKQPIDFLRFLLEAGADPNQDPEVAAFPITAVVYLHPDIGVVDLLLDHGARLEQSGAVAAAINRGNESMLRHLLERGAGLEQDAIYLGVDPGKGWFPLHVALRKGHVGVLKILLDRGVDVGAVDANGMTVLEVAEEMSNNGQDMSEAIQLLQSYKA
jgi:ankyrin repeat protein